MVQMEIMGLFQEEEVLEAKIAETEVVMEQEEKLG